MGKISDAATATTPSSSDYIPIVQGGATKKLAARKSINVQTGGSYTAVLADTDGYIRLGDGGSNNTLLNFTIPKNASEAIPVLGTLTVECMSSGGMNVIPDTGVTLNPAATNGLKALYKNSVIVATKVATDEWTVVGAQAV
jgi:hypothetical protein